MKNYYQQKKGGYTLNQKVYRKIVNEIRCYTFYESIINNFQKMDKSKIQENDILHMNMAKERIRIIDLALKNWVASPYREAVFYHLVYAYDYYTLEEMFYISTHTIKKWTQRFVFGVAKEMGEDFKRRD